MIITRFLPTIVFLLLAGTMVRAQAYLGFGLGGSVTSQYLFRAGLHTEWFFREPFGLQSDLAFAQRTNQALAQQFSLEGESISEVKQSMLEFPILFRGTVYLKKWGFFGFAGPQVSWLLNTQAWTEKEGELVLIPLPAEVDEIRKWDVGLITGLGVEKRITPILFLYVDYRYYLGLRDLYRADRFSLYQQGHYFQLGARFRLGKKGKDPDGNSPGRPE
jgi:opacity protein-like surface antigen